MDCHSNLISFPFTLSLVLIPPVCGVEILTFLLATLSLPSHLIPAKNAMPRHIDINMHTPQNHFPGIYAPCLAFSAQINAIILLSSALCAACSLMTFSSTPSAFDSSAVALSIRFWSESIFCSVLSRNGAEKAICSEEERLFCRRISSLRGLRRSASVVRVSGVWAEGLGLEGKRFG